MKKSKNLVSILLAIVMMLALATTAFAEETVNNATEHTYDVYQIFAGTQAADDTEGKLAVTGWGSGINSEAFLAALKASNKFGTPNIFADAAAAGEVAELLTGATAEQARAFGDLASGHLTGTKAAEGIKNGKVTLDAGYYLVVDTASVNSANDAKNVSLLQVTKMGDFEIQKKYDVPTVQKKVKDINDTTDTQPSNWQDSADYDIGDSVPFQLTGTLPTNYADYDTYFYQFNDNLSEGLTYNNDAAVYLVNGDSKTDITASFTLNGISSISCADLKAINDVTITKDSQIVVEYTASLNTKAIIGAEGNPNTVNLEFSNNPNNGGDGDKGKTPDDTVIVFTYKVTVNKVNPHHQPLKGAEFKLYKKLQNGTELEIATVEEINDETTTFNFSGLDDGNYVLKETKVPAGYNGIADIKFTVTADHDIQSDSPALNSLSGDVTAGEITFTPNKQEGSLSTNVVNKSGSLLPETGGIGTTLFYIFGAILVMGAGVYLVAKKRMDSSEN